MKSDLQINTSVIDNNPEGDFLRNALVQLRAMSHPLIVSADDEFLPEVPHEFRFSFDQIGLESVPIKLIDVARNIGDAVERSGPFTSIIVDMRWGLRTVAATANFERWGGLCDRIVKDAKVSVVSVYTRNLMIEDQLMAAMRGHSHFLAPSGVYDNPFWLPPKYQNGGTISQQISFVLGRLVPDYADLDTTDDEEDGAASGTNPNWISTARRLRPRMGKDDIWKIRCFGRLRIYLSDGSQVKWDIPGSAPKKTKALFSYLLQRGEKGARTDALAELLWSDEPDETKKRKRLHHTVAMLRKALGGPEFLARNGDYYTLAPPEGTWIDIASFEQLCNRAKALAKNSNPDEAITLLDAADRLYSGELFEDLSSEYFENDIENWVVPKRIWFKDMALKVLRDKAEILREGGNFRDALGSCQKALQMDPTCVIAHAETMRIFHAQNRSEAISRQYRQYLDAMASLGLESETQDLDDLRALLVNSL